MSIHEVTLADCLHPVAPPEKVLRVSSVSDTVFVSIETYDQVTAKKVSTEEIAQIAVSLPALRQALQLLHDDEGREAQRPPDGGNGDKREFIAGPRFGVYPL